MNNLMKLFALNRANAERRFEVKAEADEATIYLYDAIVSDELTAEWWGGVSKMAFIKELNALTAPVIHLRIDCPGGDVFAARAMERAIREHSSKVIAHIDGYAASAASFLALACDEVVIAKGGFFMIHKAWTFAYGNSDDLLKVADLLDKIDVSLVGTYEQETKLSAAAIETYMAEETWFNAEESLKFGFADSIAEDAQKSAAWDMSAYAHAPATVQAKTLTPDPETIDPETKYINEDHRARQQQRLNVLERTQLG